MKTSIGFCLIAMLLTGCAIHQGPTSATTQPSAKDDARTLMEHRFVSVPLDTGKGPTSRNLKDYPTEQRWTSATIETAFAFTELLPSWNVTVPDDAGVRWDVRVRDARTKEWSPWLYIGYWGRVTRDHRKTEFAGGEVEVDVLRLTSPADAFEMRSTVMSFDLAKAATESGPAMPTVRKVQAVYSRPVESDLVVSAGETQTPIDLPVPYRAQGVEDKSISGSICSPTSVSMLLQWAGIDRPTQQNALAIWDDDYALFGNWNRAVQYAASLGLDAELVRFTTMDQVRARLADGQPIIASINFEAGTFPSNVMKETDGHLIVIRGFDEAGDLIVNDPASKDRGNGIVYKADELAHAWLVNTGGVGYIIRKPSTAVDHALSK